MNDDPILMDDLCHFLNAFLFDGCSMFVIQSVILLALMTVWTMGRGENRALAVLPLLTSLAMQAAVMLLLEFMTTSLSFLIQSLLWFQV